MRYTLGYGARLNNIFTELVFCQPVLLYTVVPLLGRCKRDTWPGRWKVKKKVLNTEVGSNQRCTLCQLWRDSLMDLLLSNSHPKSRRAQRNFYQQKLFFSMPGLEPTPRCLFDRRSPTRHTPLSHVLYRRYSLAQQALSLDQIWDAPRWKNTSMDCRLERIELKF